MVCMPIESMKTLRCMMYSTLIHLGTGHQLWRGGTTTREGEGGKSLNHHEGGGHKRFWGSFNMG